MARKLALRTSFPTLLTTPLLILAVGWFVGRLLAPLASVRSQMALRKADAVERLQLPEEIRPVILKPKLLFERLRLAFDAQTVFVADAAHEMRSPLAARRAEDPFAEPAARARRPHA